MSREEAINYLNNSMAIGEDDDSRYHNEVLEFTIKALEQESCEDAISRQALIERINNAEENFKSDNMESISSGDEDAFVDGVLSGVFSIRQMVMQAQSVKPTRIEQEHILDKIKDEIVEEKEYAYADFERYNEDLGQDLEDDFRYGMERCIEIIDKYKVESEVRLWQI